jgi:hypothetical protein
MRTVERRARVMPDMHRAAACPVFRPYVSCRKVLVRLLLASFPRCREIVLHLNRDAMTAVMDRTGMRCGKAGPALSVDFRRSARILPQAECLQPARPAYVLLDKQGAVCLFSRNRNAAASSDMTVRIKHLGRPAQAASGCRGALLVLPDGGSKDDRRDFPLHAEARQVMAAGTNGSC